MFALGKSSVDTALNSLLACLSRSTCARFVPCVTRCTSLVLLIVIQQRFWIGKWQLHDVAFGNVARIVSRACHRCPCRAVCQISPQAQIVMTIGNYSTRYRIGAAGSVERMTPAPQMRTHTNDATRNWLCLFRFIFYKYCVQSTVLACAPTWLPLAVCFVNLASLLVQDLVCLLAKGATWV